MCMKNNSNNKSLEAYKIFPYVAWTLTLGFAIFVYNITVQLTEVTRNLQAQTQFLVDHVNAGPTATSSYEMERPLKKP